MLECGQTNKPWEKPLRIILPKISANKFCDNLPLPLFFLAGPVRGGGDWQWHMCVLLQKLMAEQEFYVAVPCRWGPEHPSYRYRAEDKELYKRQLDWERNYLEEAAREINGCIIFWLPCESKTDPHPGPEPYAMDTRGELGEWRAHMMNRSWQRPYVNVVVGAEDGFLGLSQIQRNFDQALLCKFPIYKSMKETAEAALLAAKLKKPD